MINFATQDLIHLLATYGYVMVLLFVAIESVGVPFPGETMLLVASVYAGTTHQLSVLLVIAAAATGAILGDNLGYWVGREGGYRLLRRHGYLIRLSERRLKLAIYLFDAYGPQVVFLGRFVAVLRTWAAFLAGSSRMRWFPFLIFNASGGILWATVYGLAGYILGSRVESLSGTVGKVTVALSALVIIVALVLIRRHERRLEDVAEAALPGPLDTALAARSGRPGARGTDP